MDALAARERTLFPFSHGVREVASIVEKVDDHRLIRRRGERLRDADGERGAENLADADAIDEDRDRQP